MRRLLPVILMGLLVGCAGSKEIGSAGTVQAVSNGSLPAPNRSDQFALERPYLIGPYDKLTINVFGVEELDSEVQTDASGRISMPLVGIVEAAGRTPGEVADIIEERLAGRYVRNPNVTVNLKETVSQVITVDGDVRTPGLYPVIGRMTLMRAVATAQGTTDTANMKEVLIFRTVDGKQMVGVYDFRGIRRGNYPDPEVYANDVVIVSTSYARRLFKDLIPIAGLLTTPLVAIIQQQ